MTSCSYSISHFLVVALPVVSDESVLQTVDIKALVTAARRIYLDVAVNEILYKFKKFKSCYSCWITTTCMMTSMWLIPF